MNTTIVQECFEDVSYGQQSMPKFYAQCSKWKYRDDPKVDSNESMCKQ